MYFSFYQVNSKVDEIHNKFKAAGDHYDRLGAKLSDQMKEVEQLNKENTNNGHGPTKSAWGQVV
jgi:hypothetical protein